MSGRADLEEGDIAAAAALLASLASEARLRILCRLIEGERSVGDLARFCGLSQSAMSQQLRRLRDAGLVRGRRSGQTIHYSVIGEEVRAVLETLHGLYCDKADGT